MKEELLKLYKEFKAEWDKKDPLVHGRPDLVDFMEWLEKEETK